MLNDYQLRQGMRRLIHSGKPHPPTLPEFVRLCRAVGRLDDIPEPQIAYPALAHNNEPNPWEVKGSQRLLAYITTKIPQSPRRYGHRDSPEFAKAIHALAAMKNRWVELMQESAGPDGVLVNEQDQCWAECMRMAEESIAMAEAA
jgi:hypothetical protein